MARIVALSLLLLCGCPPKKPVVPQTGGMLPGTATTATTQQQAVNALLENFTRVHFDTDSSRLDPIGKAALDDNAKILGDHGELRVEVQGHADERGTVDYNLALGQRRANAVVDYLVSRGVSPSRLPVVSYGEERPATSAAGEVAWAENRRAEFRVVAGATNVHGTTSQ